jgi:hypothetical protein
MPQWVVELLASWRGHFGSRNNLEAWRMAPLCMMWCISRERNSRNFEDCMRTMAEIKDIMFKIVNGWMTATSSSCFSNFLDSGSLSSF